MKLKYVLLFLITFLNIHISAEVLPFKKNDIVIDNWKIEKIFTHSEYIRITLSNNIKITEIEIRYNTNNTFNNFKTEKYVIQPAPEYTTPSKLLKKFHEIIIIYEKGKNEKTDLIKEYNQYIFDDNDKEINLKNNFNKYKPINFLFNFLYKNWILYLILLITILILFVIYKKSAYKGLTILSFLSIITSIFFCINFTNNLTMTLWLIILLSLIPITRVIKNLKFEYLITAIIIFLFCLSIRIFSINLPCNWYTDIFGPFNTILPVFVKRTGGIYLLYSYINLIFPLNDNNIFFLQKIIYSLSTTFIFIAILSNNKKNYFIALLSSLILSIDFLQIKLSSSDIIHIQAFFIFSIASILISYSKISKNIGLFCFTFCCLLIGFIRNELAYTIILLPFLNFNLNLFTQVKNIEHKKFLIMTLISIISISIFLMINDNIYGMGSTINEINFNKFISWLIIILIYPIIPLLTKSFFLENYLTIIYYILIIFNIIFSLLKKKLKYLIFILLLLFTISWKISTDFYREAISLNIITSRYDLLFFIGLIIATSVGFNNFVSIIIYKIISNYKNKQKPKFIEWFLKKEILNYSVVITFILMIILFQKSFYSFEKYSFQYEYLFLSKNLSKIKNDKTIVTIWQQDGASKKAFDTGLSLPHPLLQYINPERKWIILTTKDDLTNFKISNNMVFFYNSFCQLDPKFGKEINDIKGTETLEKVEILANKMSKIFDKPIIEIKIPAKSLYWKFKNKEISIGLYELKKE